MSLKILYVTATTAEADSLKRIRNMQPVPGGYIFEGSKIDLLVTGVGSVATAWAMKQWLSVNERPDIAINAGIAGSFKDRFGKGDVVMPVSDCFADSGIEDGDNFLTLSEAGLIDANEFPFREGTLFSDTKFTARFTNLLNPVRAITVNMATGSEKTREKLIRKYNPDIETMEGATFFYICAREKIPFLACRAVSNMVEPRNRINWDIKLAIDNLSERMGEIILTLD